MPQAEAWGIVLVYMFSAPNGAAYFHTTGCPDKSGFVSLSVTLLAAFSRVSYEYLRKVNKLKMERKDLSKHT